MKRSQNRFFSIQDANGNTLQNVEAINREVINYFSNIFVVDPTNFTTNLSIMDVIPSCIFDAQNYALMRSVSLEEVKLNLLNLGGDKDPRLNSFLAIFFQKSWDIVGKEIWEVVEESRVGGFILKDFNNNFITLIPKKVDRVTFDDYRPIALCNTIYKVIAKVMGKKLKLVLNSIISSELLE